MARPPQRLEIRFWRYVRKANDGCWNWIGATDKDGYGKFQVCAAFSWDGKTHTTRATRVALYLTSGQWPSSGLQVQHTCDNPSCVRPTHLKIGGAKENCADMRSRNRGPEQRGTCNGGIKHPENARLATLTWSEVRKIREKYATGGCTKVALGKEFGVSDCTIRDVVKWRTWKE